MFRQPVWVSGISRRDYQRWRDDGTDEPDGVTDERLGELRAIAGDGPLTVRCVRILIVFREWWWGVPYRLEVDAVEAAARKLDRQALDAALADNAAYRRDRAA